MGIAKGQRSPKNFAVRGICLEQIRLGQFDEAIVNCQPAQLSVKKLNAVSATECSREVPW